MRYLRWWVVVEVRWFWHDVEIQSGGRLGAVRLSASCDCGSSRKRETGVRNDYNIKSGEATKALSLESTWTVCDPMQRSIASVSNLGLQGMTASQDENFKIRLCS